MGLVKGDRNKTAIITAFIIGFLLNIVAALNPYSIKRIWYLKKKGFKPSFSFDEGLKLEI